MNNSEEKIIFETGYTLYAEVDENGFFRGDASIPLTLTSKSVEYET